jgi:hypothetical protein
MFFYSNFDNLHETNPKLFWKTIDKIIKMWKNTTTKPNQKRSMGK